MENFDIGIIGAGPAGYTAAFHAAAKGMSVVIFEKDEIGGVCLNKGCIPTKTVLHSSEIFYEMKNSSQLGICTENVTLNYAKVLEHKNNVVEKLRKGLELGFKTNKISVVKSFARIADANTILADGKTYQCKKIIVAAGAEPKTLPQLKFDHNFILNSDDILNLAALPKSILIVGSGAIGIEWARIFSNFGVDVTVTEFGQNLLPIADIEVSKRIERIFKTKKIKFYTGTTVEKIDGTTVTLTNGEELLPEKILVATGRTPVQTEKIEGVTYIGDVSCKIQLAHFGIKQAIAVVEGVKFDESLVPSVVYGLPEIAWIGQREQDLQPGTYQKSNLLISALGKSHCDDATEGFIKILSQNGKIIGAHIVSKEASALIHQILIAMQNNITIDKLKEVCFAHPTYSEGIFESLWRIK